MQKILKSISSVLLAIVMCLGITVVVNRTVTETIVADAATVQAYYSPITADSGTQLLGQLHDLMVSTHETYTSYTDCKTPDKVMKTDPGTASNTVRDFYTQEDISSTWNGNAAGTWNREHVWCQSLSNGLWGENGGGSDMHHLRPSEVRLNGTRGNHTFGEVGGASGGTAAYYKDTSGKDKYIGGYISGDTFEPMEWARGDVARIVMYVYMHYNSAKNVGGSSSDRGYFGNLTFTKIMTPNNEADAIKLLLKWNKEDPVNEIETTRNEAVYELQGNRNPFIDHPEYADAIWGDGKVTPTPGGDPSTTLTGLTISPSTLSLTAGQSGNLTVTATPSTASNEVNWTSSNPSVATVSNGTVTAKAAGSATITATSTSKNSISATAKVTVTEATPPSPPQPGVSGSATIDLSKFNLTNDYGFKSWSSGGISGIAYIFGGSDSFPAENGMQFNNSKTSYYLASTAPTPAPILSVKVKLNSKTSGSKKWKLLTSTSAYSQLNSGNPENGNPQGTNTVTTSGTTWTVSGNDTYFALVYDDKGVCYVDSIEITYGSNGGDTPVTPDPSVTLESLTINHTQSELGVGDTLNLSVTAQPANANAEVTWSSSNTSVATVSASGLVTAVKAGTATITATSTENPAITATCTITVKAAGGGTVTPPVEDNPPVDNPPAAEEQPDPIKLTVFHLAVAAISANGTLAVRLETINYAIAAYQALTDVEKAAAKADVDKLNAAIADYNAAVNSYNSDAEDAENNALNGFMR